MIDERLYQETFSQLRASAESKEEVLLKVENQRSKRHIPKVLRAAGIAAAMTLALAVTASAVNMATDGLLFHIVMSDGFHMTLEDENGNQAEVYGIRTDTTLRDGRLFLLVNDEEIDITDEMEAQGSYVHIFEKDGIEVTVEVTGTLDNPEIQVNTVMETEDGVTYSWNSGDMPEGDLTISTNSNGTTAPATGGPQAGVTWSASSSTES